MKKYITPIKNKSSLKSVPRLVLFSMILLCASTLSGCFFKTNSTEVGVRTRLISIFSERGVDTEIKEPGRVFYFFPFVNAWNTFDTRLQNIEMTVVENRGDHYGRDDLQFKTIDGNDISMDIVIAYRINPKKAPYILQNVAENDKELREKIIRVIARSRPRDIFGELETENFYLAEERSKKSEEAKVILNEMLEQYGVIVERLLTKDYRFNSEYQKAIEDKKIADQNTQQFKSASNAKKQEYLRKIEQAKGEVNKMVANVDGEYEKAKINADAYYQKQAKQAEAILFEGKAEAEAITKMNEALSAKGGRTMVKLKMAEVLAGKKIIALPLSGNSGMNLQTMDINQLLSTYGITSLSKTKPSTRINN